MEDMAVANIAGIMMAMAVMANTSSSMAAKDTEAETGDGTEATRYSV
jgi:hypothetical protein